MSDTALPRTIQAGPWRVTLHTPVLVYRGTEHEHMTRPNLCHLNEGVGIIMQTTFDSQATAKDHRHIALSSDGGESWQMAAHDVDIGSYSIFSQPGGEAVVMPYDSVRYRDDRNSFGGTRTTLSVVNGQLQIDHDRAIAHMPFELMAFWDDRPTSGESVAPSNKPIACFWGTIHKLGDGRWLCPGYATLADEPRTPDDHPETPMHGMGKYTAYLLVSTDKGRTWQWHCTVATPRDVPEGVSEGPDEIQFYEFPDRWRCIFRVSAMSIAYPMHWCDSFDGGLTWTKPEALTGVDGMMDPRGLLMPDGPTVLATGRLGSDMYLAEGTSLDFHKIDIVAHHNACVPEAPLDKVSVVHAPWHYPNSGHTDVLQIGPNRLLFTYDRIPDGWRWAGTPFTGPDEIYTVVMDIEQE